MAGQYRKTPVSQLAANCYADINKVKDALEASRKAMLRRRLSGACITRNAEALTLLHNVESAVEKLVDQAAKDEAIAVWFSDNIEDDFEK